MQSLPKRNLDLTSFSLKYSSKCALKSLKALANKDTLLPTQMFPRLPTRATFVTDTKNVSDFVQKHFVSATNVSLFAQPKKHHEQQCVRNNVSSFTRVLKPATNSAEIEGLRRKHPYGNTIFPAYPFRPPRTYISPWASI